MQNTNNNLPTITGSNAIMQNSENYDRMLSFAQTMSEARVTVPQHLAGNPGDCLAITMQAMSWGMNPFLVAQKTSTIQGTLCYEAQLVSAVVTNSGVIEGRPQYEFFGDWSKIVGNVKEMRNDKGKKYHVPNWSAKDEEGLGVTVKATVKGESEPRTLTVLMKQAVVRNSTNWANNPQQQLSYFGIKNWVRMHTPDVLLGVYTQDEMQDQPQGFDHARDVTPAQDNSAIDPKAIQTAAQKPQPEQQEAAEEEWQGETPDQHDACAVVIQTIEQAKSKEDVLQSGKMIGELLAQGKIHESRADELRRAYSVKNKEIGGKQWKN